VVETRLGLRPVRSQSAGGLVSFEVTLPNGDCASCETWEGAIVLAETLIEDAVKHLRQNLVVRRDGQIDPSATDLLQREGMLV
jgi:hypothetical protein